MPVTSVTHDPEALTMTVVADFPAACSACGRRTSTRASWSGSGGRRPTPRTFTRHDAAAGGRSTYTMTGPDGDSHGGYWEWLSVDPLKSFEVRDGFATPDGEPNTEMPSMRMQFVFEETGDGSRVTTTTYFELARRARAAARDGHGGGHARGDGPDGRGARRPRVVRRRRRARSPRSCPTPRCGSAGSSAGSRRAGVARPPRRRAAAALAARARRLDDAGVRGGHHGRREVPLRVGAGRRHEGERFGFEGELLESAPPYRAVTTERMIGMPGEGTRQRAHAHPGRRGHAAVPRHHLPRRRGPRHVLATGMTDGMETSYARLESEVLA